MEGMNLSEALHSLLNGVDEGRLITTSGNAKGLLQLISRRVELADG